jgi:hypothetical protein
MHEMSYDEKDPFARAGGSFSRLVPCHATTERRRAWALLQGIAKHIINVEAVGKAEPSAIYVEYPIGRGAGPSLTSSSKGRMAETWIRRDAA